MGAMAQGSSCGWGVRAGVNFANIGNSDYNSDYLTAFNAGVIYEMPISNVIPLYLEGGLYFQMKGARDNGFIAEIDNDTKFKSYNIEVPVVIGYDIPLSNQWALQPFVGLYYSLALGGSVEYGDDSIDPYKKEEWKTFNDEDSFESQLLHRSDFGLRAGISTTFNRYVLAFSYDAGFLNVYSPAFRDQGFEAVTGCFSIMFGYNF